MEESTIVGAYLNDQYDLKFSEIQVEPILPTCLIPYLNCLNLPLHYIGRPYILVLAGLDFCCLV